MKIEVSNSPTFAFDYAQSIVNITAFKRRKLVEMIDITHMTNGDIQINQSYESDSALVDISRETAVQVMIEMAKMLGYNVEKIA